MAIPFRFESVLRVRETIRGERRRELAEALQAEDILKQQIVACLERSQGAKGYQREVRTGKGLNPASCIDADRYVIEIEAERLQLEDQLAQVRAETARRQARLVEADREVKAIEKLKQRQREAAEANLRRREQAELDEVAGRAQATER